MQDTDSIFKIQEMTHAFLIKNVRFFTAYVFALALLYE